MAEDNAEDASDSGTPLDELRRSIEDRETRERQAPEIWEVLEGRFKEESDEGTGVENEGVDRAVAEPRSASPTVHAPPSNGEAERTWFPEYPSRSVYVIHGIVTIIIFIASFVIYAGAVISLIPRYLWIVSLPLFALGVFFLTPVLAWSLGIWNPTESI